MIEYSKNTPIYINSTIPPEVEEKILQSRMQAENLELRHIKCPRCGYNMLEVYGNDHHLTRAKCKKCKFVDIIDTALFRTIKRK